MFQHILEIIGAHGRRNLEKTAIADARIHISYGTLDRFSTQLARLLRAMGCESGDRVALLASRSAVPLAAMFGIFKSNCIYVPLDPRLPASRRQYILDDISPAVIVIEDDLRDEFAGSLSRRSGVLLMSDLQRLLLQESVRSEVDGPSSHLPTPQPDSVAYCIYTSGSTGRPKGVLIEHRSIAAFCDGIRAAYDVDADSVCASFSSLHFDAFLIDMLFPLTRGASLHLHDDVITPDLLLETLRAHDVTHFSAWGMMLGLITQASEFDSVSLPHLKTVLTGADVPDVKAVQRWLAKGRGIKVINGYGPTEATCAATAHVIRDIEPGRRESYPIGKPLEHAQVYLIGSQGELIVTPGVPGELLIGGIQVMKGYWNLPQQTADRIVWRDGIRCYRTGDICKYLPDGNLLFLGRQDTEVNIGGYRVHLNEVKRAIESMPNVHGSEIVLLESKYGEKILSAGILLERNTDLMVERQIELIRSHVARELPRYMVPRYMQVLDVFPTLSSGKIDRKALAARLQGQMHAQEVNSYE